MHNDTSQSLTLPWHDMPTVHSDIRDAYRLIYQPCGIKCSKPVPEKEGFAYSAHTFKLDGASIHFRIAKTTPLKAGHFVTFWKRLETGLIGPYDWKDPFDFLVISTRSQNRFGQFVFPKSLLAEKRIISKEDVEGKRALRIYPDWCTELNDQALKTQKWQSNYFLECSSKDGVDLVRAQALYSRDQI
ncbi:MAG: MepB family protein [Candidatus Nucleicultricaceae bacterium]